MPCVVVLGGTGMLGSVVVRVLDRNPDLEVVATSRSPLPASGSTRWRAFDASHAGIDGIEKVIEGADWVVNAVGIIKQKIDETDAGLVRSAIDINAMFPHDLAEAATNHDTKVIQIATDCVFSGSRGAYSESDAHDAVDVYGKTKSLGEVESELFRHLRCSIVGPETDTAVSLLGWFLALPEGGTVPGFSNHRWNGITTLHFARICAAVIKDDIPVPSPLHVVPSDAVTKAQLLRYFAASFGRTDITIEEVAADQKVNRTLATNFETDKDTIWRAAGYPQPPSIEAMVAELAEFTVER